MTAALEVCTLRPMRTKVDTRVIARAHELHAEGMTNRQIAAVLGVGRSTVWRYITDPDGSIAQERDRDARRYRKDMPRRPRTTIEERRQALLEKGRAFVLEHGRPPRSRETGAPRKDAVAAYFGSWAKFIHELGYLENSASGQRVPSGPILEAFAEWQNRSGLDIESLGCDDYPADTISGALKRARSQGTISDVAADMILTRIGCPHLWIVDRRLWGVGCIPFDGPGF